MIELSSQCRAAPREAVSRLLQGGALFTATAAQYTSSIDALQQQAVISIDALGRIHSWDQASSVIFGYAASEIIGRHASALYLPEDVQQGLPERALALTAGTGRHYEQGLRARRDGSSMWASFLYTALDDQSDEGPRLLLVATDLTAAKAADDEIARLSAALRERAAEFETLLNVMPVGIGIAYDSDCQEIQVNRAFAEVLGIRPGQNASKTAPPGDRPTNFHCTDEDGVFVPDDELPMQVAARQGRELRDMEVNVVHSDGRVVRLLEYAAPLLDAQGRVRGSVGAFVDITERNRIARRHQFLMALDDALRPLADARQITATAARLLGEHLNVSRCGYADVEEDQDTFNVIGDYTRGVPTTVGRYRLSQFGDAVVEAMRQNRPLAFPDAVTHLAPQDPHIFGEMHIRAGIVVPLHKQGRLAAVMAVHHDKPRNWTESEVELLQHVASRSWESIERTKITRNLQESETRFRQLVDAVEDYAIFMLDAQGCVSSWNNGATRITGYAAEEILGRHFSQFYTREEQLHGAPQHALAVAGEHGRYEEEGRRVRKDGSKAWTSTVISAIKDHDGVLQGFAVVTRDVTERKRAEEMFRLAVQAAASAIVLINDTGQIVFANSHTEDLFGYTRAELAGSSIDMLVPERHRDAHSRYRQAFSADPVMRTIGAGRDLYARRKDGSEFPVEVGLNPIETDEGLIILTSIVDITSRKQTALREREQLAHLAHVGRLSSLGEMLSELTHEINQPLAAATNYARACLRYSRAPQGASLERLMDLVSKCAAQTERASEIVKRLNNFVRKSPPTQAPTDLNGVVRDMLALTTPGYLPEENIASGVVIETELDDRVPLVLVDRVQIEQVLVNLIRNALDAMSLCPARDRVLRIQTVQAGEEVRVQVSDRGSGITAEHAARLFEPFFTTKSQGVGLGLSISRSIIEAHGGRIWAAPNPDGGAVFYFTLPIALEIPGDASSHGLHH